MNLSYVKGKNSRLEQMDVHSYSYRITKGQKKVLQLDGLKIGRINVF